MSRIALVTGAARGLGEGIAARLLSDGWSVVIADVAGAAETAARVVIDHKSGEATPEAAA